MKFFTTALLAFSALATSALADHPSGCYMNAGSRLAQCLGIGSDCSKLTSPCGGITNLNERAQCYCGWYTKAANCWKEGTCCTEYPPHQAGADRVCNVAYSGKVTESKLSAAVDAAQSVVDIVCHNDCGYDIPCLDEEPAPHNPNGGKCQPRSYWSNGSCTGRNRC